MTYYILTLYSSFEEESLIKKERKTIGSNTWALSAQEKNKS